MAIKPRKIITKFSAAEVLIRQGELCAGPLGAFERKDGRYLPRADVLGDVLKDAEQSSWLDTVKQCAHCGGDMVFARYPGNKQPAVCSTNCLRERELQRQRLKAASTYTPRAPDARALACAACGTTFTARRSDARFCSVRCRVAAHRSNG